MFVRRKQNKSGTTSIQVIAKVDGKYRLQKSFGSSRDESILASLERQARQWADEHEFGEELFAPEGAEEYDAIFAGIGQDQLRLVGPDLIYGRLFNRIEATSASASLLILSCWSWSVSLNLPDRRSRLIERVSLPRKYTR